jgi:hypothetical protein
MTCVAALSPLDSAASLDGRNKRPPRLVTLATEPWGSYHQDGTFANF